MTWRILDEEYRTTERYEGYPVYVKKIFNAMPFAGISLTHKHGISGINTGKTRIISFQAVARPAYHSADNEVTRFVTQQFPFF